MYVDVKLCFSCELTNVNLFEESAGPDPHCVTMQAHKVWQFGLCFNSNYLRIDDNVWWIMNRATLKSAVKAEKTNSTLLLTIHYSPDLYLA